MVVPKAWLRAFVLFLSLLAVLLQLYTPHIDLQPNPDWAAQIWSADDCSQPAGVWPFTKYVPVSLEGW